MPEDVLPEDDGKGVSIKAPEFAALLMKALFAQHIETQNELQTRVTALEAELARLKQIIDTNTGDGK